MILFEGTKMDISSVVFGLAGLLALICFMPPLAGHMKIPYSVFLALSGSLLAYLSYNWTPPVIGDFLDIVTTFDMSSETFLIVFLPVLLFETSLSMNVRRLMDDIGPILMMAIVAVIVSTLLVGVVLTSVSGMGLVACLLLGAIVATTDPAAVVSIFREVGAPKRLTTLVEGESLLNDAAAIALYSVLLGVLTKDRNWEVFIVVKDFLFLFLGGGLAGFMIGRFTCVAFKWLRGWPAAEVSLTVAVAYLSYFISEHYLHVSGVVATVVAGLVVGSTGRTRISPAAFETLSHSWHQFGFWANSLVFLLAAMLIPKMMANITWMHALYILLVFVTTLLARAIVVYGLVPLLTKLGVGARVGRRFQAVIWWGGLRGAVSFALALAVTERVGLPQEVREFIAVTVTGFILATLFINGMTLQPLIRLLGLNQLTRKQRALRDQAVVVAATLNQHETDDIAKSELLPDDVRERVRSVFDGLLIAPSDAEVEQFSVQDRIDLGLSILARREFEIYFEILKHQIIDRSMAEILIGKAERHEDAVRVGGLDGFNKVAKRALRYPRRFRQALRIYEVFGIQRWLAYELSQRFVSLMSMRSVSRQLLTFADQKLRDIIGDEATEQVRQAHQNRLDLIEQGLQALELQYPKYSTWLQECYLGRIARRIERERYDEMLEQSLISGEVYEDLSTRVGQRWSFIDKDPLLDMEMEPEELVARVPLLNGLSPEVQRSVARMMKPRLFLPDQLVWSANNMPSYALYVVASGAVRVRLPDSTHIELGSGEFFGELYMLKKELLRGFEVRSLGYSKLLCLPVNEFENLMARDASLRQSIELVAKQRLRALEVWQGQQSGASGSAQ